jgi:hypothetical protein
MDRRAGRVVGATVVDEELEVALESGSIRILSRVKLSLHRREIHRSSDDLGVVQDAERDIVC